MLFTILQQIDSIIDSMDSLNSLQVLNQSIRPHQVYPAIFTAISRNRAVYFQSDREIASFYLIAVTRRKNRTAICGDLAQHEADRVWIQYITSIQKKMMGYVNFIERILLGNYNDKIEQHNKAGLAYQKINDNLILIDGTQDEHLYSFMPYSELFAEQYELVGAGKQLTISGNVSCIDECDISEMNWDCLSETLFELQNTGRTKHQPEYGILNLDNYNHVSKRNYPTAFAQNVWLLLQSWRQETDATNKETIRIQIVTLLGENNDAQLQFLNDRYYVEQTT